MEKFVQEQVNEDKPPTLNTIEAFSSSVYRMSNGLQMVSLWAFAAPTSALTALPSGVKWVTSFMSLSNEKCKIYLCYRHLFPSFIFVFAF